MKHFRIRIKQRKHIITPKIAPEAPTIGVESMFTIFCVHFLLILLEIFQNHPLKYPKIVNLLQ